MKSNISMWIIWSKCMVSGERIKKRHVIEAYFISSLVMNEKNNAQHRHTHTQPLHIQYELSISTEQRCYKNILYYDIHIMGIVPPTQ